MTSRKGMSLSKRSRSATTTDDLLGSAVSDASSEIKAILENISKWLLCGGSHRNLHSAAIFQKWSDELVNVEKARNRPAADKIRNRFEIDGGNRLSCQGIPQNGKRCTNWISNKSHESAEAIIDVIEKARSSSFATRDKILVLAQLLMCQKFHQDQAAGKSEEWFAIVQKLFPTADAVPEEKSSTPPFNRSSTVNNLATPSTSSRVGSIANSTAYSTPPKSPPSQRRYADTKTSPVASRFSTSTIENKAIVTDRPSLSPHIRITRRAVTERIEPLFPEFTPLSPKNRQGVLKHLYDMIIRPFGKKDKEKGYLYRFKRPGSNLIKVGYTNRLETRMEELRKGCNQELTVILSEPATHAYKMETLVHAALYQERRHEVLVNGLCNGGKGCSTRHREWIAVTEARLRAVVSKLSRWFDAEPYENGILKPKWVEHIDKVRKSQLTDLIDQWEAWLEIPVHVTETTTTKTEVVDDKGLVTADIDEKTESGVPTTEIKIERDDAVTADIQGLRLDLSERSRRLVDNIIKLKLETTLDTPLTEYPAARQDLLRHMDDPFVAASAVTTVSA
jgi:hypothetical protein